MTIPYGLLPPQGLLNDVDARLRAQKAWEGYQPPPEQPNLVDRALGIPGMEGLISRDALKSARRQGLLSAGLAMLANSDRPNPWQAVAAGMQAGQQGYGGAVQGAVQADQYQQQMQGRQAMADFSREIADAGGDPQKMLQIGYRMMALGAQYGNPTLTQGGANIAQQYLRMQAPGGRDAPSYQTFRDPAQPDDKVEYRWQVWPDGRMVRLGPVSERQDEAAARAGLAAQRSGIAQINRMYTTEVGKGPETQRFLNTVISSIASQGETSPAVQVSALYGFIRGIDETSVVREGEVRLVNEAASLKSTIQRLLARNVGQENVALPPELFKSMRDFVTAQEEQKRKYISDVQERYRELARDPIFGIPDRLMPLLFQAPEAPIVAPEDGSTKDSEGF